MFYLLINLYLSTFYFIIKNLASKINIKNASTSFSKSHVNYTLDNPSKVTFLQIISIWLGCRKSIYSKRLDIIFIK
jgi:hypothetical protein